jgi:3-oxoacyl-[acyl-carrier-protein] synthase-1
MGLVPDAALGSLEPEIDGLSLPFRARRILSLAAPSLRMVGGNLGHAVPVFIGLPDLTHEEAPWLTRLPEYLERLAGVAIDRRRSTVVPRGRAAALMALELALDFLRANPAATVIVGGVDSYLDVRLLAALDSEGRILGPHVMDGFVPGEGAAFVILSGMSASHAGGNGDRVVVNAAASAMDAGHRYGDAPALGEGLADALDRARERMPRSPEPIATTFAGFNGENFDGKLWGVARTRHHDFFSTDMVIEHPADSFGDAGAAMGAILLALAAESLATGTRPGPALVWAASDREPRACAVVSVARH